MQWLNLFTYQYPRRSGAVYDGRGIVDPGHRVNPTTFSPGLDVYVCQYLPLNFWLQADGGLRYDNISEPFRVKKSGIFHPGPNYYDLTRNAIGYSGGLMLGYDISFPDQKIKLAPTLGILFYHVDRYASFYNYLLGIKATLPVGRRKQRG